MGQATVAEPSYAFRRHSRNGGANGPSHASGRQFHYARAGSAGVAPPTSATLLLDRRCLGRSRLAMERGPGDAAAHYEIDRSPDPARPLTFEAGEMKFIFADSMDFVDPGYDFLRDRNAERRTSYWDDAYPHEKMAYDPYDGVLVSRGNKGGSTACRESVCR